uniref:Small basic protein n=1 Tax=Caliciviridae sp. TaxID=1916234 RepID=A0A6M9Z6P3_9CALI|nr:MAG: small basic protein [Caliciviridae sp.]
MANILSGILGGASVATGLAGTIGNLVLGSQQVSLMNKQLDLQKELAYAQPEINAETIKKSMTSTYDTLIGLGVDRQGAFEAVRGGRYMSGGRSITPMSNTVYSYGGGVHNNNLTIMPTIVKNNTVNRNQTNNQTTNNNANSTNWPEYRTHFAPDFRNPPPSVVQAWSDTGSVRSNASIRSNGSQASNVSSLAWDGLVISNSRSAAVTSYNNPAFRRDSLDSWDGSTLVVTNSRNSPETNKLIAPPAVVTSGRGYEMPVWGGSITMRNPRPRTRVGQNTRDSYV